jgi:hypothetical protein
VHNNCRVIGNCIDGLAAADNVSQKHSWFEGGSTVQLDLQQMEVLMYAAAAMALIILAALIVYVVMARRNKQNQQRFRSAARAVDEPAPSVVLSASGHVLSLVRDDLGGRLLVEIGGTRYRRLKDVQDVEMRRTIVAAATELVRFTGVLDSGPAEPVSMEQTQTWREDVRQGSQAELERAKSIPAELWAQPSSAPREVEQQFLDLLAEMGQAGTPPDKPNVVSAIRRRYLSRSPEPEESRTFIDDIEAIIQRRIPLIPALQGRGLHIRSGTGGRVLFAFEGQEYQDVNEIPNLTARQLVKDAIQEWDETT